MALNYRDTKYFTCASCRISRPIEQLGRIVNANKSKRCKTCCDNSDRGKAQLIKNRMEVKMIDGTIKIREVDGDKFGN